MNFVFLFFTYYFSPQIVAVGDESSRTVSWGLYPMTVFRVPTKPEPDLTTSREYEEFLKHTRNGTFNLSVNRTDTGLPYLVGRDLLTPEVGEKRTDQTSEQWFSSFLSVRLSIPSLSLPFLSFPSSLSLSYTFLLFFFFPPSIPSHPSILSPCLSLTLPSSFSLSFLFRLFVYRCTFPLPSPSLPLPCLPLTSTISLILTLIYPPPSLSFKPVVQCLPSLPLFISQICHPPHSSNSTFHPSFPLSPSSFPPCLLYPTRRYSIPCTICCTRAWLNLEKNHKNFLMIFSVML